MRVHTFEELRDMLPRHIGFAWRPSEYGDMELLVRIEDVQPWLASVEKAFPPLQVHRVAQLGVVFDGIELGDLLRRLTFLCKVAEEAHYHAMAKAVGILITGIKAAHRNPPHIDLDRAVEKHFKS